MQQMIFLEDFEISCYIFHERLDHLICMLGMTARKSSKEIGLRIEARVSSARLLIREFMLVPFPDRNSTGHDGSMLMEIINASTRILIGGDNLARGSRN